MKKLFALVAILSATLLSHAQITLEHTLTNMMSIDSWNFGSNVEVIPIERGYSSVIGENYLLLQELADDANADYDATIITKLYDLNDFSLEFSVNVEQMFRRGRTYGPYCISKNIFTTDSKFAYICNIVTDRGGSGVGEPEKGEIKIISQEGNVIKSIPYSRDSGGSWIYGFLVKVGDRYKLIVENTQRDMYDGVDGIDYDIYSLPGNGEATAINEVYAPRRNARKYIHDAQVLIENEKNTYTIQGQEIK